MSKSAFAFEQIKEKLIHPKCSTRSQTCLKHDQAFNQACLRNLNQPSLFANIKSIANNIPHQNQLHRAFQKPALPPPLFLARHQPILFFT
jgi:hypothetical protein